MTVLLLEVLAAPFLSNAGIGLWTSPFVCLASYTIGAIIAKVNLLQRVRRVALIALLGIVGGFAFSGVELSFRCQLIFAGIFLLIELREQVAAARNQEPSEKVRRVRRVLVRLSGLTLYFFMFQHIVEHAVVTAVAPSIGPAFGTFDYWGLILVVLLLTLLVAVCMSKLEQAIRSLLS